MKKQSQAQFLYKKNRLKQIQGFYYSVRYESISKAAKAINLTQSTVSLQIQSLERDLGFKLIKRNSKNFSLTDEGKKFYEEACPLMQQFEYVVDDFLKKNKKHKKISIAVHHIAISYLLPRAIHEFKKKHPDVEITIQNISPIEAIKRLKDGEIDMAFYPNLEKSCEIDLIEITSFEPILVMNKNHQLAKKPIRSLKMLEGEDLIRIDSNLITLPLFEETIKKYNLNGSIKFENGNWEILKHFVKHNNVIAVLSSICIDRNDNDLAIRDLSDFFPMMDYTIAKRSGEPTNAMMNDFVREIKKSARYQRCEV